MQHYPGHHYRYTPEETAGRRLHAALAAAGLNPHLTQEPVAGGEWVTVPAPPGEIRISNAEAAIDHHPRQHGGWTAEHIQDCARGTSTIVYATGIRDFGMDTAGVVGAVRSYLTDPAPWANPDQHAACGPYITAGEFLRRALERAGVRALHLLTLGREGAFISVPLPQAGRGSVLITSRAGAVGHTVHDHPGWEAAYCPKGVFGDRCTPIPIAPKSDFAADTDATVRSVSGFLGRWRSPR